jgi:hypothetical protein
LFSPSATAFFPRVTSDGHGKERRRRRPSLNKKVIELVSPKSEGFDGFKCFLVNKKINK